MIHEVKVKNSLWWCVCGWAPRPSDKRHPTDQWTEHYREAKK